MADEGREETKLERRELHLAVADGDTRLRPVDREVRVGIRLGLLLALAASGAARQRLNARDELLLAERLHEVVVCARLKAAHALELVAAGGEHQDRDVGHVADPLQHVPAVELGHRDVEDDEVGPPRVELAQAVAAVLGLLDLRPAAFEERPHEAADVVVVVDDEHSKLAHTAFIPRPSHIPSA